MTKGTPPFLFIVPSRRANHEAGLVIRSLHIQIWVDETWGEGRGESFEALYKVLSLYGMYLST